MSVVLVGIIVLGVIAIVWILLFAVGAVGQPPTRSHPPDGSSTGAVLPPGSEHADRDSGGWFSDFFGGGGGGFDGGGGDGGGGS